MEEIFAHCASLPVDTMDETTGDTPLLLSCRLGFKGVVEACLRLGARNDPHPSFGQTALQAAVAGGHGGARLILEEAAPSMADRVIVNHVDPNKQVKFDLQLIELNVCFHY